MMGVSAFAQDVLITKDGDVKNVYDVEIISNAVFYKSENKADAAISRINKDAVFMIKRKDGTKYDLGNNAQQSTQTNVNTQQQPTPSTSLSAASQKRNEELITYSNTYNPEYVGKKGGNAGLAFCILAYNKNSQLVNDDIEINVVSGRVDVPNGQKGTVPKIIESGAMNSLTFSPVPFLMPNETDNQAVQFQVKNKTSKTIYIDLGNSFFMRNGVAQAYYIPTATTTNTMSGSGVGVNLGSVAGALGIGGAIGTLANGVNVGGGSSSGTSNTVYSQRVVAVPPMSITKLYGQVLFTDQKCNGFVINTYNRIDVYFSFKSNTSDRLYNGDVLDYTEDSSPFNFGGVISYSFSENCSSCNTLSFCMYMRRIIGYNKPTMIDWNKSLTKSIPDYGKVTGFIGNISEGINRSVKTSFPR